MRLLEPCCASRQLCILRDAIGNNGRDSFEGFGDMSLTELLPALLLRYTETEMMIVAPSIPDQATAIIREWLNKKWARWDGKGQLDCLSKLTIIADLSEDASPEMSQWLKENPFVGRLTLVNRVQSDTALLLPDIAITGPLNFRYADHFVCNVTSVPAEVNDLWAQYAKLASKPTAKKKASKEDTDSANGGAKATLPTTYTEPESTNFTVSADDVEPVQEHSSNVQRKKRRNKS